MPRFLPLEACTTPAHIASSCHCASQRLRAGIAQPLTVADAQVRRPEDCSWPNAGIGHQHGCPPGNGLLFLCRGRSDLSEQPRRPIHRGEPPAPGAIGDVTAEENSQQERLGRSTAGRKGVRATVAADSATALGTPGRSRIRVPYLQIGERASAAAARWPVAAGQAGKTNYPAPSTSRCSWNCRNVSPFRCCWSPKRSSRSGRTAPLPLGP